MAFQKRSKKEEPEPIKGSGKEKVYYTLKRTSLRSSILLKITVSEDGRAKVEELRDDVHMVVFGKLTKLLGEIDAN